MYYPDLLPQRQATKWSCGYAAAAIIAGVHEREVFGFCGYDGSYENHNEFAETFAYLASKRIMLGVGAEIATDQKSLQDADHLNARIEKHGRAILTVRSRHNSCYLHAVVWTGVDIIDPSMAGMQRLEDYHVEQWWPVLYIQEGGA